jgi:hypothetical protein
MLSSTKEHETKAAYAVTTCRFLLGGMLWKSRRRQHLSQGFSMRRSLLHRKTGQCLLQCPLHGWRPLFWKEISGHRSAIFFKGDLSLPGLFAGHRRLLLPKDHLAFLITGPLGQMVHFQAFSHFKTHFLSAVREMGKPRAFITESLRHTFSGKGGECAVHTAQSWSQSPWV